MLQISNGLQGTSRVVGMFFDKSVIVYHVVDVRRLI